MSNNKMLLRLVILIIVSLFWRGFLVDTTVLAIHESDGDDFVSTEATAEILATINRGKDDPNFLLSDEKDLDMVRKRSSKRCNRMGRVGGITRICQESCDFRYCKAIPKNKNKLTVGVYYYPWYGNDFHRGGDPGNPQLYLRRQLNPQQLPSMGEYDDRKKTVIGKHLKWSRRFNIDLWVLSWWGEDKREDLTIKNHILVHNQLKNHQIAIHYETMGRIREKDGHDLRNVISDLKYLCQQYFYHPNYYNMAVDTEGNPDTNSQKRVPVLFVYLTRELNELGLLSDVIDRMREGAKEGGCDEIFIVGDQVFQEPPKTEKEKLPFEILDAVTTYDVYGSMRGGSNMGYVGSREKVVEYYQEQDKWRAMAKNYHCAFIPAVSPGFNDRGVRLEENHIPLSRRLNKDSAEGSLFRAALEEARTIVDPSLGNLIMVNSWNEFHEDTQIEPVYAIGKSKKDTNLPSQLTCSLDYKGYGQLYLRILKNETEEWDPSGVMPSGGVGASVLEKSNIENAAKEGEIDAIVEMIG